VKLLFPFIDDHEIIVSIELIVMLYANILITMVHFWIANKAMALQACHLWMKYVSCILTTIKRPKEKTSLQKKQFKMQIVIHKVCNKIISHYLLIMKCSILQNIWLSTLPTSTMQPTNHILYRYIMSCKHNKLIIFFIVFKICLQLLQKPNILQPQLES
jgi:hypothetical protein